MLWHFSCAVLQKPLWFAFCREGENHLSHWGIWSWFFLKGEKQIGGWNPFCFIRSGISASSFSSPENSKTVQTSSSGRPGVRPTSRPLCLVICHHSSFEDYIPGRDALIASGWFPANPENENKSADSSSSTLWQLGRDSVTNPFTLIRPEDESPQVFGGKQFRLKVLQFRKLFNYPEHWMINQLRFKPFPKKTPPWLTGLTCVQVSPDLQNEVLMSLLETDPDVVDYLLRRKASQ